jgi:hypothetical protein
LKTFAARHQRRPLPLIQQRALDHARITFIHMLHVRFRPKIHLAAALCLNLRIARPFDRVLFVNAIIPLAISFAPELHDNLRPHTLAIGLNSRRKSVGQFGFNDFVQFFFGHLSSPYQCILTARGCVSSVTPASPVMVVNSRSRAPSKTAGIDQAERLAVELATDDDIKQISTEMNHKMGLH